VLVKQHNVNYFKAPVFAVAPMIDWTDRANFR
jgi:tRNA-dihydrouridine synthase A